MKILRWIVFAFVLTLFSAVIPARALPANAALARMQALAASVKSPHVTSMQAQAHTAAWTVLVYMAADNDLESYGIADLNEMEFIGSTENLNIVVQVDRSPRYDSTNGDWSGARRYFMTQDTDLDNVASQQVGDLGVINMGDPATLKDFIDWGVKTYPAQHYGLVIWDHGGSWLGVGIDDSANDDALQLPELDSALKDSLADSKLAKFDLIGFDACLMGSIEVYRTLAPYASYAVASPELIPGQGWDYAGAFSAMADDPTIDAPTFGHAIVDSFNTFYTQVVTNYDYFSLGLVDLSQTGTVVSALDSFTGTASDAAAGESIARARSKSLVFGAFDDPQYADIWAATDMVGFMQQVQAQSKDSKIIDASNAVIDAGQKMILYHLSSKTLTDSQGVSIYFPRTSTFFTDKNRDTRYGQDTPSDLNPWQKFLGTFYALFSGSHPSALITSATAENNQALFKLSFNAGGLSDALFYIALRLNDKPILVDYRRFDVGDFAESGQAEPTVTWAKSIPVVSDGTTQVPTLLIKDRRNPLRGIINGTFVPQNGDPQVAVQVLFDLTDPTLGKSISVWGIRDSLIGPMPSQINVQPGDKFIPSWLSIGANGQLNNRSSDTTLTFSTQPLTYFLVNAPDAVYDIGVQAVSPAGVVAATTTQADVSNGTITVSEPETQAENNPSENPPEEPTQPPTTPPPSLPSESSSDTSSGNSAGINSVSNSSVTSQVGQPLAEPFQVKIVDSDGHGVSGETVTFTAPSNGPSGTFAPEVIYAPTTLDQMMAVLSGANTVLAQETPPSTSITTQTDNDGTATSTTFTTNTTAGSYVVTATTSSGLTLEFHITNAPDPAVAIAAVPGTTPQSTGVDTDFAIALQALVTDQYGNSVPNVTVTFTSYDYGEVAGASFSTGDTGTETAIGSDPIVTLLTGASVTSAESDSGSVDVVTNNLGLATAPTLTANGVAGSFTAYASFIHEESQQENPTAYFELTNLAGSPANINFTGASPTSTEVTQAFNVPLTVMVVDSHYNAVTGGTVTFTTYGSDVPSATFDDADPVANTITVDIDSNGYATSGPLHANTHAGTFSVTASLTDDSAISTTTDLVSTAAAAENISVYAGTPQSTAVGTPFSTNLQMLVTDHYGNPVPNVGVTFGSAYGGESAGASYESSGSSDDTETTDENGIATASTLTANTTPGDFQVSASTAGVADPITFDLTNVPGDPATLDLVGPAEEETTTVGTDFPYLLEVAVYDQYGNPVPGVLIHWSAPLSGPSGTFANPGEITGATAPYREAAITTDASGSAVPPTFTADTGAGSYPVHVTYDDDTNPLELFSYLTNTAGAVTYVTPVDGASDQHITVNQPFANPLAVIVQDAYFNPVPNAHVTLTANAEGANGSFAGSLSSVEGDTDSDGDNEGIFTPPAFTANSRAGTYTVAIAVTGFTPGQGNEPEFSLTNDPGPAEKILDQNGSQSTVVDTAFALPILVKVTDHDGNGISGVTVTFTAPSSGASGKFASSGTNTETTGPSDSDGLVTSSPFTANRIAGTDYVLSVSGMVGATTLTPAVITMTNRADAPYSISSYSGLPQQVGINGTFASALVAKVIDQYTNPIEGVTVVFNAPSSDASGTFASNSDISKTVTTSATGLASSATSPDSDTFTANGIGGDYTVTASVSGTSLFASFVLTNLNPAPTTTGITPSTYLVGDAPITSIIINGTNFISGVSVPQFDGADRVATSTTPTQIVMQLESGDLTAGTYEIRVKNPYVTYSGGASHDGISNAQTFTVTNPTPQLDSLDINTLSAGDVGGSITITGSNFVPGAEVHWLWTDSTSHDVTMTTQYVSATELTFDYDSSDIDDGKYVKVEVHNPDPVVGVSNQLDLTVNNPVPNITPAGYHGFIYDSDTSLDVTGTGNAFVPSSSVSMVIGGSGDSTDIPLETTFVSSTDLRVVIPAEYFDHNYSFELVVHTPAPGGGDTSGCCNTFTVYDPDPTITSLDPTSVNQYGNGFTLTINGSNFVDGDSDVLLNGEMFGGAITFVNSGQLTLLVDSAYTQNSGTLDVQVVNQFGYQSGSQQPVYSTTEQVNIDAVAANPVPILNNVTRVDVDSSGNATIDLEGGNFMPGVSTVYAYTSFSGVNDPVTVNSATFSSDTTGQAVIQLNPTYADTYYIEVTNPAPGGGTSEAQSIYLDPNEQGPSNPPASVTGLSPSSITAGSGEGTLTITGSSFLPGAVVLWGEGSYPQDPGGTSTSLSFTYNASDVECGFTVDLRVGNPPPGGGSGDNSNNTWTVNNPDPELDAIGDDNQQVSHTTIPVDVDLNGSGFVPCSTVTVSVSDDPGGDTTDLANIEYSYSFDTSAHLVLTINAPNNSKYYHVKVSNSEPGGGDSDEQVFQFTSPG